MPLTLQLVNETTLPDGGPVSFRVSGKRSIDIGRAAHLDWTLPDPSRYISSKHCEIRYNDAAYWLHDVSTNGTFLNGADHRMHAPHRLRSGDRFTVGHYIVAVMVDGTEETIDEGPRGTASPPVHVLTDQELWANEGDIAPPINPKELRSARHNTPVNADFLDWAADVPDPFHQPVPDLPALSPTKSVAAPTLSDMDWADGPPLLLQSPPPPLPSAPTPRRPGWDNKESGSGRETTPVAPLGTANITSGRAANPVSTLPPPMVESGSSAAFVRQLARSAGLADDVLAQKDPAELAQQIGTVLLLLAENLMQLLSARQQAKRLAHSSSHTMIQATDNNPLKFCPSAQDALRILFGPATSSYLDAQRAIVQGFEDLKVHEIKTYTAMQQALVMVMADLDPKKIERETDGGAGIGSLLQPRKAKLWDAYEARWKAKIGRKGGEPIEAFMRYFAEFYDNPG